VFRRIALIAVIAGAFTGAMYTSIGCFGFGSPTEPSPPDTLLNGTVRNSVSGAAVVNAMVTVSQGQQQVVDVTTPDGRYGVGVLPGENRIDVTAAGYQAFSATITIPAGRTTTFNIQLTPAS
jgi:hypothetical protein